MTIGSRVKYATQFLRNISCFTGPLPFARGAITAVSRHGIATIAWDGHTDHEELPNEVHLANLSPEKQLG